MMRYVSHSNRLSDYRADQTTLWLLVLLLVASILALLQIISMNSQVVVIFPSKNQSARSLEVSQEFEQEAYSVNPSQVPLILQKSAEAYMASELQIDTIPDIENIPVPSTTVERTVIPQVVNVQVPLVSFEAAIETAVPTTGNEILSPTLKATESLKDSGTPSVQEPTATEVPIAEELSAIEAPVAEEPTATEASVTEDPTASEAIPAPNGGYNNSFEEEVIRLLNEKRAELGLSQLTYDPNLTVSADIRAQEISVLFSHTRPDGSAWNTSGYGVARGENLAYGQSDPTTVIADWMASSTHQDNMLRDIWTIVAVSCYEVNGVTYWVQHFA